jgi:hypothetical protein
VSGVRLGRPEKRVRQFDRGLHKPCLPYLWLYG